MNEDEDPWRKLAEGWQRHSSPLRPHPDDTAIVERVADGLAKEGEGLDAVMLGVTPETAGCVWPPGTRLRAFDSSPVMLQMLWPAPGTPAGARAELGDWSALPIDDGEADLVAADGSLGCPLWPADVTRVLEEVRRILRPGGRFVARTGLRPEQPETLDAILADLDAGRIGNPTALKVRVIATLHTRGTTGFWVGELQQLWHRLFPDVGAVAERFGWSPAAVAMPDNYSEDDRFLYPTLTELRSVVDPHFRQIDFCVGSYELADRFPTLVLEPR